jgi:hypothetical protein
MDRGRGPDGAKLLAASPPPTANDGQGKITWTSPPPSTAVIKRGPVSVTARLPAGARVVLASSTAFSGVWYVPQDILATSLVFALLGWRAVRWRRRTPADRSSLRQDLRRLAWAATLGLGAALAMIIASVLIKQAPPPSVYHSSGSVRLRWDAAIALVFIVAAVACRAAVRQPRLEPPSASGSGWTWRPAANTGAATAAITALLIIGVGCFVAYNHRSPQPGLDSQDLLLATGLLVLGVLVFEALPAVVTSLVPATRRDSSFGWVGRCLGAVLLLVVLASILGEIEDTYRWFTTWDLPGGLWEQLGSEQMSEALRVRLNPLPFRLVRYTVTLAATLIILMAILAVLWRLQDPATQLPPTTSGTKPVESRGAKAVAEANGAYDPQARLRRALLALLFAGFVVGWIDYVVVVSFPLAFILALVLFRAVLPLSPQPRPQTHVPEAVPTKGGRPSWLERLAALGHLQPLNRTNPAGNPKSIDLGPGPRTSAWANAVVAVDRGWRLAIPFIIFDAVLTIRTAVQASPNSLPSAGDLFLLLVNDVVFWLVAAFTLGYGYVWLRGRNGVVKGVLLAAVAISAEAITALLQLGLGQQSGSPWQAVSLRGWLLLLFLAALGARLDVETLRNHELDWPQLDKAYQVERMRFVVVYVAPLLLAVLGVVQQVRSGQGEEALRQALENAPRLFPGSGGG